MKTILVPTDFSKNARHALHFAAALATQIKAKIIIAHIINLPVTIAEGGLAYPVDDQLEDEASRELTKLAAGLAQEYPNLLPLETVCEYGYFIAKLNHLAQTHAADLVIMGTRGTSNFLDKFIGSNTYQFIKAANVPVLAVPANATFTGLKNITYASDLENPEDTYLSQLFALTEPFNSQVILVNISTRETLDILPDHQVIRDIETKFTGKNLAIKQENATDIVAGLERFIQENPTDALALPLHARSFLENLFHHSTAKDLLSHIKLPVLTLPAQPFLKERPHARHQTFPN